MTFEEFGNLVWTYRHQQNQNLRCAAIDVGVGYWTLQRIEKGKSCKADSFLRVCYWAGIDANEIEPEGMK